MTNNKYIKLLAGAVVLISMMSIFLGVSVPAQANEITCVAIDLAEDDMSYYVSGRWIHDDGNVSGWARQEDSAVFSTPQCAGLTLEDVVRPATARGIVRF